MCVSSPFALLCTILNFEPVLLSLSIPKCSSLAHTTFSETSSIGSSGHSSRLIQPRIEIYANNRNRHTWDVELRTSTDCHHGMNDKAPGDVNEPTLEFYLNPQPIPGWHQVFGEWLQERQQGLAERGYCDMISFRSSWAQLFGEWLQRRWSLLHNQGLRDPTLDRPRWIVLFDFWFSTMCGQLPGRTPHISPCTTPHSRPTNPSALLTPQSYARLSTSNLGNVKDHMLSTDLGI